MKKLLLIAILAAVVSMCAACKKTESTGASGETGTTASKTDTSVKGTTVAAGASDTVDDKLEKLWRLDLPELGEHQTLHDDRVKNYVVYFPDNFVIDEKAEENDENTISFVSESDGASLTLSAEDNSDAVSLKDYSELLAKTYPGADVKTTGKFGITAAGIKKGGASLIIKAVVTEKTIYKAVLSYPDTQSEKYALPENEILLMVVGLDKNGDPVEYNMK